MGGSGEESQGRGQDILPPESWTEPGKLLDYSHLEKRGWYALQEAATRIGCNGLLVSVGVFLSFLAKTLSTQDGPTSLISAPLNVPPGLRDLQPFEDVSRPPAQSPSGTQLWLNKWGLVTVVARGSTVHWMLCGIPSQEGVRKAFSGASLVA